MLNVILLGLTSLLADFSSEMVFPILPFFIQTLGGAGVAIGLAFGIGDAVAAIFKVISGRWADKTKKYRTFVVAGYAFSAVAKFLYPLSSSWRQILAVRPVERIGKGFRDAPRDAILSESLSHERRGRGFGIQRAMDSAGAVLGAVAVLIFVFYLELDFSRIFWISAI
ncbi:MAG: MFS transporter, partial [Candidatus Yanofskybacteria bacterium]|nr:MFS transporter [Candidatus Yanofskybacteria bacterium]